LIKKEEFCNIRTSLRYYSNHYKLFLENLAEVNEGIFDKFKNINKVTEKECCEITRWTSDLSLLVK
jgi:hypothetical protein